MPDFAYRELDSVRVKGKDIPVKIFEPIKALDLLSEVEQHELNLYTQALQLYRSQNWELAAAAFANLHQLDPTRDVYTLYAERITHFFKNPPESDWDGTFNYVTK